MRSVKPRFFSSLLAAALAGLVPAAAQEGAGRPSSSPAGLSFEAALKATCPARNLEFLDPAVLATSIREYVQGLPDEQRNRVVEAGRPSIASCGANDITCATRSALATLRQQHLTEGLAREMCRLPYHCQDWSECQADRAEAAPVEPSQSAPGENVDTGAVSPPSARPPQQSQLPQPPTPAAPPPASTSQAPAQREMPETQGLAAQPAPAEPDGLAGASAALLEKPPRPATPQDAVRGFYGALSQGDGIGAEWFVVREKRGEGHFRASEMERFYGGLVEPIRVESIDAVGPLSFRVRYHFVARGGARCNGLSIVKVRDTDEGYRVAGIEAPSGC